MKKIQLKPGGREARPMGKSSWFSISHLRAIRGNSGAGPERHKAPGDGEEVERVVGVGGNKQRSMGE